MSAARPILALAAWLPSLAAARYIRHHRDLLAPEATPLPPATIAILSAYFDEDLLAAVRTVVRQPLPLRSFPFASSLQRAGIDVPSPHTIAAIALDHVVAAQQPLPLSVLFHELVHVQQYRLLGVDKFARQYVRGALATRSYPRIPLEACAFTLEAQFTAGGPPFSVTDAVAQWLRA